MADYCITGAEYDSISKYIELVKAGELTGTWNTRNWLRAKVISELDDSKTFITVLKHGDRLKINIATSNGKNRSLQQ